MFQKLKAFLFENQTLRQTVAKNTLWLSISNIGGRLLRAIIIIYAARVLGASGWGVFSYTISLIGFLTVFMDLGIGAVLTRETARSENPRHKEEIVSTAFFLKLALGAAGVLAVIFIVPHFATIEQAKAILPIVSFILIFDTLREFGASVARAIEKMQIEAGVYLLTNAAIVTLGFLFLSASPTVTSFTYAYVFGTGIGMVTAFFALRKYFHKLFSAFSWSLIKPIFQSAWPVAVSSLLAALMLNTDVLIIGYFLSAEDVGFYSAAERIVQLLYILPGIIAMSVFPLFSRLALKDNERVREILERVMSFSLLVTLPIGVGGALLSSQIIHFVFGAPYSPAGPPFQVLVLGVVASFSSLILMNAIFAYNRPKVLLAASAIGGGTNVILDLVFIPQFGIVGSAWVTLISLFLTNAYLFKKMSEINSVSIAPHIRNIVLGTLLMTTATLLLILGGAHVLLNIGVSALVYFGILYALREPLLREAKLILRMQT